MKLIGKSFVILMGFFCITTTSYAQDDSYQSFGEKITAESAITVKDLLSDLGIGDSVAAKVYGQIDNICQMKGCWMNIRDGITSQEAVFVQFKDYAFFVPKDASGKDVVIEGIAYRELTPVEELRHYAEDAGKSEEEIAKITEPKEEIRFMAKGVLIKN